jgi:hypothetical protein
MDARLLKLFIKTNLRGLFPPVLFFLRVVRSRGMEV